MESSWKSSLQAEFEKDYFKSLVSELKQFKADGKMIYPNGNEIFEAFKLTPIDRVKVVILGQDPYHGPNQAMGLSFSVRKGVKVPASLKRIYKELADDVAFSIPEHGDLTTWAEQGVFLLNAMLTVEAGHAGSHQKIGWQQFTDAVMRTISNQCEHVVFLLWGNFAKSKAILIDQSKHLVLQSAHPSPLAGNRFFGNHHFSLTNSYLRKHQKKEINWQL